MALTIIIGLIAYLGLSIAAWRWLRRHFKTRGRGYMADDWTPGDLALCVKGGGSSYFKGINENSWGDRLRPGAVYTVRKVEPSELDASVVGLWLVGVSGGWIASRFRKIRPHTPDAEDTETIRLLTGEPVLEPAQ